MLDVLELFRIRAGGRPLLLFLILFLGVLALRAVLRGVGRSRPDARTIGRAAWIVTIAGALALPAYVASAIWYASEWHFFDNAEATMISVGWLFHAGQPIYHAVDAPERYTLIYGPLTYIVHGVALSVFGPGIGVSKALSALAALASLALTFFAARREAPAARAAIVTGIYALLLLIFRNYSFWTRPEPFQLCTAAASLLFAAGGRGPAAAIAAGVASGMLWNFKITGPLYTLPVLALLYRRSGWRNTVLAAGAAAIVFAAPFVAFSNVSLLHYVEWIRLSARTGLLFYLVRQNLEWTAFLLLPLLLSFHHSIAGQRRRSSNEPAVTIALVAGMIGVVIVAAKPGAGPYHLMPFLPVIAYLVACNTSSVQLNSTISPGVAQAAVAFVVVASIVAIAQQAQLVVTVGKRRALQEIADVEAFASGHQGTVELGYGSTEALSFARPVLTFRNNFYLLDQPAIREHQLAGIELPQATVDAIARCQVSYWLVPKGEAPFSGLNSYTAVLLRPLYSEDFRSAFLATHARSGETRYYDVWQCKPGAAK